MDVSGAAAQLTARALNRVTTVLHSAGIAPNLLVTLEVIGRKSGRVVSLPLVMVVVDGQRYLVSMRGEDAQCIRNVRDAGGRAVIRNEKP